MNHVRQGDILRLSDSTAYALVISRDFYNRSGMAVLCPIVHFAEEELSDFYDGTLNIDGQDVFVLNVQAVIEKVGKEIAAA